jgi:hypothetical protein
MVAVGKTMNLPKRSLLSVIVVVLSLLFVIPTAGAAVFEIASEQVAWEQVGPQSFLVKSERERFDSLDRVGRFVCAVQVGKDWPKLEELSVHWQVKSGDKVLAEKTEPIAQGLLAVSFDLTQLQPGRYDINTELRQGDRVLSTANSFFRYVTVSTPSQSGRIALNLPRGVPLKTSTYPITCGVPFPKGALWSEKNVRLVTAEGTPVPAQFIVRSRWGHRNDPSIRWLGVDFQAASAVAWWPQREETKYFLEYGPKVSSAAPQRRVWVRETDEGYLVNTEVLRFLVRKHGFNLLDNVTLNGKPVFASSTNSGAYLVDQQGSIYRAINNKDVKLSIEEQGPLRVVIRAEGWYVKDGSDGSHQSYTLPTDKLCKFVTRIEAYAGKPYVRVLHTWINTADTFTVRFRDIGISLPVQNATSAQFGVEGSTPITEKIGKDGVHLVQHKNDAFAVESKGKELTTGKHSAGWVLAQTANGTVGIGHRETWQRFPKELEVLPDAVKLHIWPAHGKDHPEIKETNLDQLHKLWFAHQGKELNMTMPWSYYFAVAQKVDNPSAGIYEAPGMTLAGIHSSGMGVAITSDILLLFSPAQDAEATETANCFQTAPSALPDTKWLCDSLAVGYIHQYDPENYADLESIIADTMRGYWETQNETGMYGMWIYRSWNQHYEGHGVWDPYRLYNATHHYDAFMPWLFYARSGDPFFLTQGEANIRLLSDVQTIHYDDPAYPQRNVQSLQGRLVGSTRHTNGYAPWGEDHGVLAHLTCYNAMILAYYLTGDLRLREVVVDEWQKTITTDRKNPQFKAANRTLRPDSGRDNSNAIGELIDLYQLTYNPALLAYLEPMQKVQLQEPEVSAMWDWGQPLSNEVLFDGTQEIQKRVDEFAQEYTASNGKKFPWWSFKLDPLALAAIAKPDSNYAREAYLASEPVRHLLGAASMKKHDANWFTAVPDTLIYLPRVMYAMNLAEVRGGKATVGQLMDAQPLPKPSEEPFARCIAREDKDQAFEIHITGYVDKNGAALRVFDPNHKKIVDTTIAPGVHSGETVTVPRDGVTGQYVIFLKDKTVDNYSPPIQAPLTTLPGEVYCLPANSYWLQGGLDMKPFTRFFTRSTSTRPETIALQPARRARAQFIAANTNKVLADHTPVDIATDADVIKADVGPQGAWVVTWGNFPVPRTPMILSVTPDRWFMPDVDKLTLKADAG